MSDNPIQIKSVKEQFVPAEFTLIDYWSEVLEKEGGAGTCWLYIVLQRYTNREERGKRYGKAWPSIPTLARIISSSTPTVIRKLKTLEKFKFVTLEKTQGESNVYTIVELPEPMSELKIQSKKKAVKKKAKTETKEEIIYDEDAVFGAKEPQPLPFVIRYWHEKYKKMLKAETGKSVAYGKIPYASKEGKHFSKLIEEYGVAHLINAIDYLMSEYRSLIESYPTVAVLYGYRRTLFTEVEVGKAGRKNQWKKDKLKDFKGEAKKKKGALVL